MIFVILANINIPGHLALHFLVIKAFIIITIKMIIRFGLSAVVNIILLRSIVPYIDFTNRL